MTLQTERLRTLRLAYGMRGDTRGGKDVAYIVYAVALLTAIVGFPLVRAVVVSLSQPEMITILRAPGTGAAVGAISAMLLAGMAWLGRLRGPVTLQPFFVTLLAATDLPRSVTLRRSFLKGSLLVTVIASSVGVLFAGTLLAAGAASPLSATAFVLGSACFGFISSVVWLAGQCAALRHLWASALGLVAGAILVWAAPAVAPGLPWGWVGLLWPNDPTPDLWALLGLTSTIVLAAWCVPRLLNFLEGSRLLDSAERWQTATGAAISGDVAYAVGLFRAAPTVGRAWNAVAGRGIAVRFLRRDLVATLRTPGRFATATFFLLAAWIAVGLSFTADTSIGRILAAAGAVTGYLAVGVFSDGFRYTAETAAAPPLYGYRTPRLYLLHSLLPVVMAGATATVGIAIAVFAGAPLSTLLGAVLLVPLLVLIRAYDSARGPLPVVLLTPVSTPAGDMAGLSILAWQADSLLIAAVSWTAVAALASEGQTVGAMLVLCVVGVALGLMLRRRLRGL